MPQSGLHVAIASETCADEPTVHSVSIRLALVLACLFLTSAVPAAATLPAGFSDTQVTTFDGAMALAFTPGGRLLIAGRTGQLRVFSDGASRRGPR